MFKKFSQKKKMRRGMRKNNFRKYINTCYGNTSETFTSTNQRKTIHFDRALEKR